MKQGKNINDLAKEVKRQLDEKKDYLVPHDRYFMAENAQLSIHNKKVDDYTINDHAHFQIADKFAIPHKYYSRMLVDCPSLLAANVNHWIGKDDSPRLIRLLDGKVRAFLSNRYRPLDNFDLMTAVLPVIEQNKAEFVSGEVTETRFYFKALQPSMSAEIKPGDIVQAGISIQNSEVGASSIRIEPLIYRLICKNGLITNIALKKYHIGKVTEFTDAYEVFTDATKELTDKAFWNQVKDVATAAFSKQYFDAAVEAMKDATQRPITRDPKDVVEVIAKKYGHSDKVGEEIFKSLIAEKDLTQYGLSNAITATSQIVDNYDLATELERTGGKVIEMSKSDWAAVATA